MTPEFQPANVRSVHEVRLYAIPMLIAGFLRLTVVGVSLASGLE